MRGSWMGAAAALMAACLSAPVSAQQASPASPAPAAPDASRDPPADARDPLPALPTSFERVKEELKEPPALKLDVQLPPVFRIEITERVPRHWELSNRFYVPKEPRTATTRWHDEFLAMTTPPEFRAYSPALTQSERAVIAASSLAFAGVMALMQQAVEGIADARRNAREAQAREEVEAAWRAFVERQRAVPAAAPPD